MISPMGAHEFTALKLCVPHAPARPALCAARVIGGPRTTQGCATPVPRRLETPLDEFHIDVRRANTTRRLLLKAVQHINGSLEPHDVDRPESLPGNR